MGHPATAPGSGTRLRVVACGSVDDGKSTLIGRLLFECDSVSSDQLAALTRDSRRYGTTGDEPDFALLLDGLEAEREQGITIDVAYRYFSTARRRFVVADVPGHEEYTRNMETGASNSEAAVLLADARKGILTQTRRHAHILSLLGIRHIVLAVNKMDLMDYSAERFARIAEECDRLAAKLSFASVVPIPVCARNGDNVTTRSPRMPWYDGPVLLQHLESLDIDGGSETKPMRFTVQWINRTNAEFRGYAGSVVSGILTEGQEIVVTASGVRARVNRIVTGDGDLKQAVAGQAVTLVLSDEIGISRGDILTLPEWRCETADQFAAHVVWLTHEVMLPHREYLIKFNSRVVPGRITALRHRLDPDSLEQVAARALEMNEIGYCHISTREPVSFDPYRENRETGGFIIIDRQSNATAGAGMIDFALRRAANVHWHELDVNAGARAGLNGQKPCLLWFTGFSGAGKSTIANLVERRLFAEGRRSYLLDGDNIRHGLNRDLGFTAADRVENIRRVTEVARLFVDAGLITLVAFISPFSAEREAARESFRPEEFHEIYVDTPLEICRARDPKGLYARAASGRLKNFTGFDSPYEPPLKPELVLRTAEASAEELASHVIGYLRTKGLIP